MTSRFTLGAAFAGLISAGCSSPAEDDPGPPASPPPLANSPTAAQGGSTGAVVTPPPAAQGGTTGQTGVVPAGTGGSAVAVGGAGGAPAAAAGAGGAPAGAIPTGMGFTITPGTDGWVAGSTNAVGIQGSFHTFSDATQTPPGDTTIAVGDFGTPTSVCVSGVGSQVLGTPPAFSQYYGGGLGLNLADPGGMLAVMPWTRGTVTGFTFTVTGTAVPPAGRLRFNATSPAMGPTYCGTLTAGANRVTFGSLVQECYNTAAPGPALGTTAPLESIQWQVVTDVAATIPFDFCIENLTAITTP